MVWRSRASSSRNFPEGVENYRCQHKFIVSKNKKERFSLRKDSVESRGDGTGSRAYGVCARRKEARATGKATPAAIYSYSRNALPYQYPCVTDMTATDYTEEPSMYSESDWHASTECIESIREM